MKYKNLLPLAFLSLFTLSPVSAFELLKTTVGAEAAALGGATAATVKDPTAIFWNPAGLANINGKDKQKSKTNLAAEADQKFSNDSFDKLFENTTKSGEDGSEEEPAPVVRSAPPFEIQLHTTYGYLSMNRHLFMASSAMTLLKGTIGLGLLGTYVPLIDGYDMNGISTGSISYGAYAAYLGYAWESGIVKMGASLSGYQETLATQSIYGGGLNMGVQMTPIPILHIGAALQNLPGVMQYSTSDPSKFRKLETIMKLTLGITTPPPDASFMLLLGLEANLDQIVKPEVYANIGLQMKFAKYFSLMAGLRNNNFALGLGFNLPFIKVAYAINQDPLHTGFQHFVDISLSF